MKKRIGLILLLLLLSGGAVAFWLNRETILGKHEGNLKLGGNIDDRQLNLAFQIAERIAEVRKEEGESVRKGEIVATLEEHRLKNSLDAARAACDAAKATLEKLQNGTRKEDIGIARAGVDAARAKMEADRNDYKRQSTLEHQAAVSVQISEKAQAAYLLSKAALSAAENHLEKQLNGPRKEEIALAAARLAQAAAQVAIQEQMLRDAVLRSPCDGIIRSRLLHPGEMTSPQLPVLTLAVISPKWVRVYLPEPMLTKIRSGGAAKITFDGMPGKALDGWVGFISPSSEFTPKNVETPELRASLVYEVRVMVKDPDNLLKLGAPATVEFPGVPAK